MRQEKLSTAVIKKDSFFQKTEVFMTAVCIL